MATPWGRDMMNTLTQWQRLREGMDTLTQWQRLGENVLGRFPILFNARNNLPDNWINTALRRMQQ